MTLDQTWKRPKELEDQKKLLMLEDKKDTPRQRVIRTGHTAEEEPDDDDGDDARRDITCGIRRRNRDVDDNGDESVNDDTIVFDEYLQAKGISTGTSRASKRRASKDTPTSSSRCHIHPSIKTSCRPRADKTEIGC